MNNIVDCHALAGAGFNWLGTQRQMNYDLRELFERGAEAGLERYCIMSPRGDDYPSANKRTAGMCERDSKRLIGFAVHSPQREAGEIRGALAEEVRSMGLRGLRTDGHPTREVMDAAAELRIPVMYYPQPGRNHGETPARWYHTLAATYPMVNLILPHLGQYGSWAWYGHMEALDLVRRYPNVYVDTSAIGSLKYLEMAVRELPPERILFGSHAPELDPRVAMEAIRLLKLPPERLAAITGANLLRLLPG
jgi:predicted TIM-barrel fold metal-dependent hydrolase